MRKYIIVAESGADLSPEMIKKHNIHIVAMHVEMGQKDYLDGQIPVSELTNYYEKTKKVPKTAGVNPDQYTDVFIRIKDEDPNAIILHICYSAKLSIGWQSSFTADDGTMSIQRVDAKNVSIGHAFVVMESIKILSQTPDIEPELLVKKIEDIANRTRFSFMPGNLDYLRAGGRVSNAQHLAATLLKLTPLIEVIDGLMISTKKFHGGRKVIIRKMLTDYFKRYDIDKEEIFFVYACVVEPEIKEEMEKFAYSLGVKKITWLETGGVITSHSGPYGIGIAGIEQS